jgi:hypothetical protein
MPAAARPYCILLVKDLNFFAFVDGLGNFLGIADYIES